MSLTSRAPHFDVAIFNRPGLSTRVQNTRVDQGNRADDAALCDVREQAQSTIQTRLAAAIGAGNDVQPPKRKTNVAKRSGSRDGKLADHRRVAPPLSQILDGHGHEGNLIPRTRVERAAAGARARHLALGAPII